MTDIIPQKVVVDGTLVCDLVRRTEEGNIIVDTGHGTMVVNSTRVQLLA